MLAKRVIPCIDCDYRNGRVVVLKGRKFEGLRYAGDPVRLALDYQDADEFVMLDIGATTRNFRRNFSAVEYRNSTTIKKRGTFLRTVSEVASACSIPLCVGGGVRSFSDFEQRIKAGADQCAINTAALQDPSLIGKCASEFGSQAVVVAIDAKKTPSGFECFSAAGTTSSGRSLADWLREAERRGAGEILLTSIDRDGTGEGFDIPMLRAACKATSLPIIASGGCSSVDDMAEVFAKTGASGALAASIFHFGKTTIRACKKELLKRGIEVRL